MAADCLAMIRGAVHAPTDAYVAWIGMLENLATDLEQYRSRSSYRCAETASDQVNITGVQSAHIPSQPLKH